MTVSPFIEFPNWHYRTARNEVDFLADTINASLLTADWTPDLATDVVWGDISANECADGDYVMQVLGTKTITLDGSDRTVWDCADINFGDTVSIAGKYLVLWRADASAGLRYLMAYADLNEGGGNLVSVNDDFDFAISANGIMRYTPNAV